MAKKKFTSFILLFLLIFSLYAESLSSKSSIDWTKNDFRSLVHLNLLESGFSMPSGRSAAVNKIHQQLPFLIKSPLLTVNIDSSLKLGDAITQANITLDQLSTIIQEGKFETAIYKGAIDSIALEHHLNLVEIAKTMIKHQSPIAPEIPLKNSYSREFSGIVIDMRGNIPVHGEFTKEKSLPCLFPKIYDQNMNLLYERNMVYPEITKTKNIVRYAWSLNLNEYKDTIGSSPLYITAREIFGINRTDPVIAEKDALKILTQPKNIELLKQGKVVFLLEKEQLVYNVKAPLKDEPYYYNYTTLKHYVFENKIPGIDVSDAPSGMLISIRDLNFEADSAKLLTNEKERLDAIAKALLSITSENENTIMVEGHTASVGKPFGELELSKRRAETIRDELIKRGIDEELFNCRGYGGTIPLGNNETEEGRALNRRVEITVVPKATYIQRSN